MATFVVNGRSVTVEKNQKLLRYLRDLTQQKTGQVMGLSQVQVSRLEKKARAALKAALAE